MNVHNIFADTHCTLIVSMKLCEPYTFRDSTVCILVYVPVCLSVFVYPAQWQSQQAFSPEC